MIQIQLLGRFGVRIGDHPVPAGRFGGRRTRSLIAFLATRRGSLVPKDVLVEALWGNAPPANPSGSVDVLASRARRALDDPSVIEASSGGLALAADERIEVDAEEFAEAVDRGRNYQSAGQDAAALTAFREALDVWGDPLPDEAYSDWAEPFRRDCAALRQHALECGAHAAIALGNGVVAAGLARSAVAAEPLRESANLLLVSALALGGDQVAALQAFDTYRRMLADELGLDPSREATELHTRILRGVERSADSALRHLVPEAPQSDPRATIARRGSGPMRARMLASMALMASGADDYGRASDLVDLAIDEAGEDMRALAEALYAGSIVDMNLGLMNRAEQRASEALAHFEKLGDDAGIANILDGRAMATFMEGRVADSVAAFDRVAGLFRDAGTLARVVTPLSTKGHALVFMGKPVEALAATGEALAIALSLGERENESYARWHRSEALSALGRTAGAVESASHSLEIAESLGHREWTVAALRALGIAFRVADDLDASEQAHRRGLSMSEGIPLFSTWHAANLALTLIAAGKHGDAAPFVKQVCGGSPALGLFEARLAEVRLLSALGDERTAERRATLLADAEAAGYHVIVEALQSVGRSGGA